MSFAFSPIKALPFALEEERQAVVDVQDELQQGEAGELQESQAEDLLPEEAPPQGYLLTGTSFLFTWNIGVEDPHAVWLHFLQWRLQQAAGRFEAVRLPAIMEESLRSEDVDHVHIHEQREVCKRLTRVSLDPFACTTMAGHVVRPNAVADYLEAVGSSADGGSRGRGAAYRAACDRANFDVQTNKFGTQFTETDWPMQANFRVQAKWLYDLLAQGKLSRDQWLQYAADTTIGFSARKRNFEALGFGGVRERQSCGI